eukprot:TRINITY_DN51701_c0_g1_i1.p1 TRINITY_DN51701_c0_g1~~TRINITY_DN51701_c0_g1_i1.p1  ORF type:complete len:326 (+),score=53.79 TRINITY_DN51701_c0_g1_i1:41-1018(+)
MMIKKGSNKLRLPSSEEEPCAAEVSSTALFSGTSTSLEDWQELAADGLRCKPCRKMIDSAHLETPDHAVRLLRWQQEHQAEASGYPEPELPYLAYIPYEGFSTRQLTCLLCRNSKRPEGAWVADLTIHCGTHEQPAGSKEHNKNLRNYPPNDPWYVENVINVRRRWHPPQEQQHGSTASAPDRQEQQHSSSASSRQPKQNLKQGEPCGRSANKVATCNVADRSALSKTSASLKQPPVQAVAMVAMPSSELAQPNSRDRSAAKKNKIHRPSATCASQQSVWLDATHLEDPEEPMLPPGWESAQDTDGNTYYYHCEERISQWEVPVA